ncbi:MAG: phosphoglycolate phosphatase [Alphaproteobacteria bacterium]|jgi:phosphoglycolate phosphatase|nr:phosphoglycolate phosphatase [Alphaproteobacteria bacterium]MDP6833326.1 phosphoglycolate phosphatase [Alphaproteobacteria bacterium]MDP6876015.1 phosphoglycolate phosphatase [Alphaproteobacteria bacterium]
MPYRERFDAVLFDLDGTLIETAPDLCGALNYTLAKAGRDEVRLDQVRHMIGDGARTMLRLGLQATGEEPADEEIEKWFHVLLDYYWDHVADESFPFPGALAALESMRAADLKLAVCTNKPVRMSNRLFEKLAIDHFFDAVLGGDSLAVRKPDAGHILGTLDAIGVAPDRAVMIGDSANDLNAARNAGIPVVLVTFGYTTVPVGELDADALIDHFDELLPALSRLA